MHEVAAVHPPRVKGGQGWHGGSAWAGVVALPRLAQWQHPSEPCASSAPRCVGAVGPLSCPPPLLPSEPSCAARSGRGDAAGHRTNTTDLAEKKEHGVIIALALGMLSTPSGIPEASGKQQHEWGPGKEKSSERE